MKILCAVDGSQCSEWAVEAVGMLFGQHVDELLLLHVADTQALRQPPRATKAERKRLAAAREGLGQKAAAHLQRLTKAAAAALHQAGSSPRGTISTRLRHGRAASVILKQAEQQGAHLIVLGSRGICDDRGFLLGSVSRKVVAQSPRSVLVVKQSLTDHPRLLLATDGSRSAKAAAAFLHRWPLPQTAHLTVLSVVPPLVDDLASTVLPLAKLAQLAEPAAGRTRQLVDRTRETFLSQELAVDTAVMDGRPDAAVTSYAKKSKADLIVLGSRNLSGADRYMLGSTSEHVVQFAPCSVLVVKRNLADERTVARISHLTTRRKA